MDALPAQAEAITSAIRSVCTAETALHALELFQRDRALLEYCKFVFASDNDDAPVPGLSVGRDFANGAAVRSLFRTRNVVVLDRDTIAEMRTGISRFEIDYSISLDTNALSYLLPHLECRTSKLPPDFAEVFAFIADPNTNVDPVPYRMENVLNLTKRLDEDARIHERLRAYEVLRTLDPTSLDQGIPRSSLTESELTKRTQEQMSSLYDYVDTPYLMNGIREKHAAMYCLLLKMCTIQLARPKAESASKMIEFCEFCDRRLATIFARETLVARRYFERGQKMAFFGKIMIKGSDLLARLRGMAWDLWHLRQMELHMTIRPSPGARYFFPALLTFDKGLIEIMDIHPLRALGYDERIGEPCAVYDGDLLKEIAGDTAGAAALADRYLSTSAQARRNSVRDSLRTALPDLVNDLESDFRRVAGI